MIILMVLILLPLTGASNSSAGSSIFANKRGQTDCWNEDDIVKLRARQSFEDLMPKKVNPQVINAKYIKDELRYFRKALRFVEKNDDPHLTSLLKEALADTIGAHLRSEILPTVRFAFYAGFVPYRYAKEIHNFYEDQKKFLNTQGIGWKEPEAISRWSNVTVDKILIGSGAFFDPCAVLVLKRDSNSCIHLPTPKFDDVIEPTAIALPFKTSGLVSLTSSNANNALLKYYTTASRCILGSSSEKCRHSDFLNFNNEMWYWIKREVAPHLADEKLYPAYGGVLRIAAAVQTYGKGLTRRNLFEYQDSYLSKWHPWSALSQSYLYINTDWTPKLYIGLVVMTAIAIYLIQMCYSYTCGDANSCQCKERSWRSSFTTNANYANVESKIPAILPQQSAVYYSDKQRTKRSSSKTKSASLGSVRAQRVYDLNENTEKLMAIISDNEKLAEESMDSEEYSHDERKEGTVVENKDRSKSPPKIEASLTQVKVERVGRMTDRKQMYSTSTVTQDPAYRRDRWASDSVGSYSESSSSTQSVSSNTSKSYKSRSSRDLAWARKVISKHSLRTVTKTSSRTELDVNSYTTPPSGRY